MTVRKAVTFRASSIGDALNAKYLFENIHAAYPNAKYALVVANRGAMIRDLLAAYPWIDVLVVNRKSPKSIWSLWRSFYASDLVVTPYAKPGGQFARPSKLFARLLAKRGGLIGFADVWKWNKCIYDKLLPLDFARAPRLLEQDALRAAGIPITVEHMRLNYVPQPGLLERLGLDGKRYLVLHLFAGAADRGISNKKRQELVDALAQHLPQVPIVFTGTKDERAHIEKLQLPSNAHIVAGELSIQELAELIKQSTCMVSLGTGPSHMASNLEATLLVLVVCHGINWCGREEFGDAAAAQIFSNRCPGGHDFSKQYAPCIESVNVEEVAEAAERYF